MSQSNNRIGLPGFIFLILFVGKVFEIGAIADWSWWLIAAPLLAGPAFLVAYVITVFAIATIVSILRIFTR